MKNNYLVLVLSACFVIIHSCKKEKSESGSPAIISSSGNIIGSIDSFRNLLGSTLNTTTGQTTGRREINWDGVPDSLAGKDLPLDLFNPTSAGSPVTRQRGLAYATGSGGFRISNSNFSELNVQAASQFSAFSGNKTFANVSSNQWEVSFQLAGQSTPANVKGFGAVFSDVDLNNSTSLEFFNGNTSLGKYFVPPHNAANSFSFLGVYFNNGEKVTSIQISHQGTLTGTQSDISNNGTADLIVLDDFLYSEPVVQ